MESFVNNVCCKLWHKWLGYPLNKEVCLENLAIIHDVFKKHKLQFWLSEGTALGFRRDNDFIEWDDDLDIGVWSKDVPKLKKAIKDLKEKNFVVGETRINGTFISLHRKGEKVDIDITGKDINCVANTNLSFINGKPCKEFIHTLKFTPIKIKGRTYNLPSDDYLVILYGENWRTPIKGKKPEDFESVRATNS
jgi:LicD family